MPVVLRVAEDIVTCIEVRSSTLKTNLLSYKTFFNVTLPVTLCLSVSGSCDMSIAKKKKKSSVKRM